MPRPPKERLVMHRPRINEFGPYNDNKPNKDESLDNNGNATILTLDELEAMRLADLECLSQEEAAALMNVSRQTFGRIVEIARKKNGGCSDKRQDCQNRVRRIHKIL